VITDESKAEYELDFGTAETAREGFGRFEDKGRLILQSCNHGNCWLLEL
jgi:hypothetical protein